jgi:hypothetical protein
MSEHPEPSPDEKETAARRLQEAMNKMSTAELCNLMIDIQAKIREAVRSPEINKLAPGNGD